MKCKICLEEQRLLSWGWLGTILHNGMCEFCSHAQMRIERAEARLKEQKEKMLYEEKINSKSEAVLKYLDRGEK